VSLAERVLKGAGLNLEIIFRVVVVQMAVKISTKILYVWVKYGGANG
jgi:hypothetical protein